LELATLLIRAGFHIVLLPECHAKTADLECSLGRERFVVEVTAMLESHAAVARPGTVPEEDDSQTLATRVMARINQKAKQLVDYRAPVLLAINLPPERRPDSPPRRLRRPPDEEIDLKRMAGMISLGLPMWS